MTSENGHELLSKIQNRQALVGIVGLGYVGLPLALTFCEKGFPVLGFDVDQKKIDVLARNETYIVHLGAERVQRARAAGRFDATSDFNRLAECDAILIAVPTPLTLQREPDMRYVVATAEATRDRLRPGQLIVLESTTYPGTTDELVRGILEQTGMVAGKDFFLAFSPEREDPGNPSFDTKTIPKIVGGLDVLSTKLAVALYELAIDRVIAVSSARAAEATKLTENIFRAVNIALVNELKVIYDRMGIDIWEVLDAAETKPFGFMRFNPGPGLGGHCIPLDPFYLTWKAREFGVATRFVELAGEVNVSMPRYVIDKLSQALNAQKKPVNGSRVLLLGLAYKKNVDDTREAPSFELMRLLHEAGAVVDYHDPHVPEMPTKRSFPTLKKQPSVPLTPENVASYDAVLIATDHTAVDYAMLAEHALLIIDSRGVYRTPRSNVVKA